MTDDDFIIKRLSFTAAGDLLIESTFVTEAELNGINPKQAPLPMFCQAAELPVTTAGPLFQEREPPDQS